MKCTSTLTKQLAAAGLSTTDAQRLVLEMLETLGTNDLPTERTALLQRLRSVVSEGVNALHRREQTVSLETAAWRSVEVRQEYLRPASLADLRHFMRRLLRVEGAADRPLRAMGVQECRSLLERAFGNSPSSYKKGRAVLHSVFAYGMRQEWCDTNPVARIAPPRVKEKSITPLTAEEIHRLETTARRAEFRDMRLPLHLMLYCGIRPAEVTRLRGSDVQGNAVLIRPETGKTGGGRLVPLRQKKRIADTLPHGSDAVAPRNWRQRWLQLRRAAGFTRWVPDVCRHTFASYHAAYFRNLPELQWEMGHRDATLLRSRYISPIGQTEARKFWKKLGSVTPEC